MIRQNFVFKESQRMVRRCGSRDPFDLLDEIKAVILFSRAYAADGLKGYCTILNRTKYVVINGCLPDEEQAVIAGHECAHLVLHRDRIISNPLNGVKDFRIYDNSSEIDREANFFLADFIVSDKDALEAAYEYDFFEIACELGIPAPLLAYKYQSMRDRRFQVRVPIDVDSLFLRT